MTKSSEIPMNNKVDMLLRIGASISASFIYIFLRIRVNIMMSKLNKNKDLWVYDSGYEIHIPYHDISIIITAFGFFLLAIPLYKSSYKKRSIIIISMATAIIAIAFISPLAYISQSILGIDNLITFSAVQPASTLMACCLVLIFLRRKITQA